MNRTYEALAASDRPLTFTELAAITGRAAKTCEVQLQQARAAGRTVRMVDRLPSTGRGQGAGRYSATDGFTVAETPALQFRPGLPPPLTRPATPWDALMGTWRRACPDPRSGG